MLIRQAAQDFIKTLTPQYGEGETRAIYRYVFEDYFGFKNLDEELHDFLIEDIEKITQRIMSGEPVQYVVGFSWFYGLKLKVNSSVLIPRPETEELVEWILETTKNNASILDIGTGSGCIPITLKTKNPALNLTAIDISEAALITASRNAFRLNADVDFKLIDILNKNNKQTLPKFDTIVSNPPYIPNAEKALMHNNVLHYEPHLALFVDDDSPLIFYEKIAEFAEKHLNTVDEGNPEEGGKGYLFFECNEFNAEQVVDLLSTKRFKNIELRKDMSGKDRMIRAVWAD